MRQRCKNITVGECYCQLKTSGSIKKVISGQSAWTRSMTRPRRCDEIETLLQDDFLQQFRTDDLANFRAFFRELLSGLFATDDLVSQHLAFRSQAVHGSVVLVLDRHADVPILRTVLGLLQEHFVV